MGKLLKLDPCVALRLAHEGNHLPGPLVAGKGSLPRSEIPPERQGPRFGEAIH
jgi:hypothetical protein